MIGSVNVCDKLSDVPLKYRHGNCWKGAGGTYVYPKEGCPRPHFMKLNHVSKPHQTMRVFLEPFLCALEDYKFYIVRYVPLFGHYPGVEGSIDYWLDEDIPDIEYHQDNEVVDNDLCHTSKRRSKCTWMPGLAVAVSTLLLHVLLLLLLLVVPHPACQAPSSS